MKMIFALALAASLSACVSETRITTPASIAKAADRATGIEAGYAVTAEVAAFGAKAFSSATRVSMAKGDGVAYLALTTGRTKYPLATALEPADAVRLANAIDRSDAAHAALQIALLSPD